MALDLHCLHDVDTFAMDSDAQLTKQATLAMGNNAQANASHVCHDAHLTKQATFAMGNNAQLTKQATFAMGNSAQEAKQATFAMGNISLDITRCG